MAYDCACYGISHPIITKVLVGLKEIEKTVGRLCLMNKMVNASGVHSLWK